MSRPPNLEHAAGAPDPADGSTVSPETLIALLSDDYARAFLEAIRTEPKSARRIAEECGASRATAYRRLNDLEAAGLVASDMAYDADGHHRRTFSIAVESVGIELGESGFEATVTTGDHPSPTDD